MTGYISFMTHLFFPKTTAFSVLICAVDGGGFKYRK